MIHRSPAGVPSRRLTAVAAVVALTIGVLTWGTASAEPAEAVKTSMGAAESGIGKTADLTLFRPGNIISNEVFFNSATMSEAQIDSFLRQKVPQCQSGYTCLKDFRQSTTTRSSDSYCSGYQGEGSESAARIIFKVAQSCGINPQVLIVTLEKEQGLVTHTWPSDWRYTIAMGQGCPDTAACDTRYYGFYNQMYGAARQFKIYTENRYFTYYAPGKTWNLRYSPDAACGSSPVYVENQATANLYYYTPYQPNAASIRAGYGQGDGCSTYGNRNFYQRFTDWFGSTQSRIGAIVQATGRSEVYLVMNGKKHHVTDIELLHLLRSRLGSVTSVPTQYVDELPEGLAMSRYVHDARTGTLFLLERDGTKHRFESAAQIATFGYPFSGYVDIDGRVSDAFTTGTDVASFAQISGQPEVYLLEGGQRRHIYDWSAWEYVSRGLSRYIATLDPSPGAAIPVGPPYLTPNTLVRAQSSGDVMLVTPTAALVHVPSFALAADFGATTYRVLADAALAGRQTVQGSLTPFLVCDTEVLVADKGSARLVASGVPAGITALTLSQADCAGIPRSGSAVSAPLFVQPVNAGEVYLLDAGKLRHIRAYSQLTALNGPRPLSILGWSSEVVNAIGIGAPVLADGSFVQFQGTGEVYQVADSQLRHVQSMATLLRLGGGNIPPIEQLPAAYFSAYVVGAALT